MSNDQQLIDDAIASCIHQMMDITVMVRDIVYAHGYVINNLPYQPKIELEYDCDDELHNFAFYPYLQTVTSPKRVFVCEDNNTIKT